jgi:hypothetical protein
MPQTVAIWEQLVQEIKSLIQSFLPNTDLFAELTPDQVWDQIAENVKVVQYPAILLTIEGLKEQFTHLDEDNDAVTRPILVAIVDTNDPDYVEPRAKYLLWRQSLLRAFQLGPQQGKVPISGPITVTVDKCDIDLNPVVDRSAKYFQFFRSGFLLKYRCIEPRGIAPVQV